MLDPEAVLGATKYERILAVKRRYDPDNTFHVNHNIPHPEGASTPTSRANSQP